MEFDDNSRFYRTDKIIYDGVETVGVWNPPDFLKERPSDEFIKRYLVTNALEGRPDLVAHAVYGIGAFDWVLIAFNKVKDPLNWPKAGETIEYPSEMLVEPSLSS